MVALDTEPGDVTVHFGHTLHAAPPPTDRSAAGRRALYLTFVPPLTFEMIGPGQGYNDVLFTRTSGGSSTWTSYAPVLAPPELKLLP